jgi:Uma2 family endonuclease
MIAELISEPVEQSTLLELLRPDPLPGGLAPEERTVFCGISWDRYLAIDKELGDDRAGPRMFYLDGELEIVTASNEHERIKTMLGDLLPLFFDTINIEIFPRGQATMRDMMKQAGAEPDESWCFREEKQFPDLVLEVALTSGGVKKLEIYRRFGVPEVWFWRRGKLDLYALEDDGARHVPVQASRVLPTLDLALLHRCLAIQSWREARQAFRAGLTT